MLNFSSTETALGRGVYSAPEALRLLNFHRTDGTSVRPISRQTVHRWLCGYEFEAAGNRGYSAPLWKSDYANDNGELELSFRDLIELRFVKAFRDFGLSMRTIRQCFEGAVAEVDDARPFSTQKFRTDGRTIFLDITRDVKEGELVDLRSRQAVFREFVAPSLRDLEFDADVVARWYPLGEKRRSIVIDPARAFGRPVVTAAGVPTIVLARAVCVEGSEERVAQIYDVSLQDVRDAVAFEARLAA